MVTVYHLNSFVGPSGLSRILTSHACSPLIALIGTLTDVSML